MAPGNSRLHGLLAGGSAAQSSEQRAKPLLQRCCQLVDAERCRAGGCEFEGERQAVKLTANAGYRGVFMLIKGKRGAGSSGTVDKQARRCIVQ